MEVQKLNLKAKTNQKRLKQKVIQKIKINKKKVSPNHKIIKVLSLGLNLKIKLNSQKVIIILLKNSLLKKKRPSKGNISILKKLASLQNRHGQKCLKKKNSNMFYLKNLMIKKRQKNQMHLKTEEDQRISLLMVLKRKEVNPKKDQNLLQIKMRNQVLLIKKETLKKDQNLL